MVSQPSDSSSRRLLDLHMHVSRPAPYCTSDDEQDTKLCSASHVANVHKAAMGGHRAYKSSSFWFSGVNLFMFSITCAHIRCTVHELRDRQHMLCRQGPIAVIMSMTRPKAAQSSSVCAETSNGRETPILVCTSCKDPNHSVGASHEMYL